MIAAPDITISSAEYAALRRALEGAARFAGATSPNPPVGCVLLDEDGAVLAEGYHMKAGEAHAEAAAIASAARRWVSMAWAWCLPRRWARRSAAY